MDDGIDEFLAAPEELIGSTEEKQKYRLRKARQRAEEEQLRAMKSSEVPTDEDILADIIRVAEDPDTNPYWKFKTISRKRYRLYGWFPVEWVDERWGTFHHALEIAGLRDKPGTRLQKYAKAEASRRAHVRRYEENWILPYVYSPECLSGVQTMLSISDTHATYLDPATWVAFCRAVQMMDPDFILLNGDILEGSAISRHPKTGREIPLQVEFDFARSMFMQLRGLAPDAEIIWVAGNHGLTRISSYLAQVAPALANLRSMRFDQLAGLDDLGIHLAQGGELASPEGTEHEAPGLLLGEYRIHHGTKLGQNPAMAELKSAQRSGQSGHVHRASLAYGATESEGAMSWMSTPAGCTEAAGRAYMKGTCTGWQTGFGVAFLHPGGRVHQYPVVTSQGVAVCEGLLMELPRYGQMPHDKNWMEGFEA